MDRSAEIDRTSPIIAPRRTPLLHQSWHHLLFAHWDLPPEVVRPLVPAGLELDLFDGRAWVGLVPFTITGTRATFTPPVPLVSDFHEVNVRTYVHRGGKDPGVWFFSLDAASLLAVAGARAVYRLAYFAAEIRFDVQPGDPSRFHFVSKRHAPPPPPGCDLRWTAGGATRPAAFRSLDFFLVERYLVYGASEDGTLWRGQVHHQAYPLLEEVALEQLEESLLAAGGIARPEAPPLHHASPGVDVRIYAPERVV
ncbi:MAG: YqjF family protein [Thermoanaerobaculia bacterium]